MKVTGLNGREYNLDLKKYINNDRSKRSFYHVKARELIKDIFHGYNILEEVDAWYTLCVVRFTKKRNNKSYVSVEA